MGADPIIGIDHDNQVDSTVQLRTMLLSWSEMIIIMHVYMHDHFIYCDIKLNNYRNAIKNLFCRDDFYN
jgi:hypothetical protein